MRYVRLVLLIPFLLLIGSTQAFSARILGEIATIEEGFVTAVFPERIRTPAVMVILAGEGESVSGVVVADSCSGSGPYTVKGHMQFASETEPPAPGKQLYVDTLAAPPVQPRAARPTPVARQKGAVDQDLKFYYFAAGQTVGYGAAGLGYERTVYLAPNLGMEFDGAITGLGNIGGTDPGEIDTQQLIQSYGGRLKLDLNHDFGFYSGYRYISARGCEDRWDDLTIRLNGRPFTGPSSLGEGSVLQQGIEYGFTMRPLKNLTFSAGYIPELRVDFGTYGVLSEPAYTGELRFGMNRGAVRLRGLTTEGYWSADLGVTIR